MSLTAVGYAAWVARLSRGGFGSTSAVGGDGRVGVGAGQLGQRMRERDLLQACAGGCSSRLAGWRAGGDRGGILGCYGAGVVGVSRMRTRAHTAGQQQRRIGGAGRRVQGAECRRMQNAECRMRSGGGSGGSGMQTDAGG